MGEPLVGLKGKLPQEGGAVLGQGVERWRFPEGQGEALSEALEPCSQPCSEQKPGLRPPEVLPSSLFCAAASELQFLPAEQPGRRGESCSEEQQLPGAGRTGRSPVALFPPSSGVWTATLRPELLLQPHAVLFLLPSTQGIVLCAKPSPPGLVAAGRDGRMESLATCWIT